MLDTLWYVFDLASKYPSVVFLISVTVGVLWVIPHMNHAVNDDGFEDQNYPNPTLGRETGSTDDTV